MDELDNLNIFFYVAKLSSFRLAAETLGIPSSKVSRRITQIENSLGVALFKRTTRSVQLTKAGSIYFDRCQQIIELSALAKEEVLKERSAISGLISISAPVDFTIYYVADVIADFMSRYPEIHFNIDMSPRQTNLTTERFDLALRMNSMGAPSYVSRELISIPANLYASPQYLEAKGNPKNPDDLMRHQCLRVLDMPWTLSSKASGETQVVNVNGPSIVNNIGFLKALAVAGKGIFFTSERIVESEIRSGKLKLVMADWEMAPMKVYILSPSKISTSRVRIFYDFLRENIKLIKP